MTSHETELARLAHEAYIRGLDHDARTRPRRLARRANWLRSHGEDASDVEATLNRAGRCRVCGRQLTSPESAEAGIGPECRATADSHLSGGAP